MTRPPDPVFGPPLLGGPAAWHREDPAIVAAPLLPSCPRCQAAGTGENCWLCGRPWGAT